MVAENSSCRPAFTPATADYAQRVRASFDRQGIMKTLGAELVAVGPGYCSIAMVPRPEFAQQHGYMHAGVVATIADNAGGFAAYTLFPADASVLAVEFKLNLLAPAVGDRLVAEAQVVKPGRTLGITRVDVYAETAGVRKLAAIMQQTVMVMHGKSDAATARPDTANDKPDA